MAIKNEKTKQALLDKNMRTLNLEMKTGSYRPVYLFCGEEEYLKKDFKIRLKRSIVPEGDNMNLTVFSEKDCTPDAIISMADTMPFFADRRLILIEESGFFKVRKKKEDENQPGNASAAGTGAETASGATNASAAGDISSREGGENSEELDSSAAAAELAEYLDRIPEETTLLFYEREADSRGKLYKAIEKKGLVVDFVHPDEKTLEQWIMRRLEAGNRAILTSAYNLFRFYTGDNMEHIANELEKLISYTEGREPGKTGNIEIIGEDVEQICIAQIEHEIFRLTNAMTAGDQKKTLDLYYEMLARNEAPMRIFALISRQFNQLYQMRLLRDQGYMVDRIAEKLKMNPYAVQKNLEPATRFETETLRRAVEDCADAETRIKTGKLQDRLAVEMLLVKYSSKQVII